MAARRRKPARNGGKGGRASKAPVEPVRDTSRDGSPVLAKRARLADARLDASGYLLGQTMEQRDAAAKALSFLTEMATGSARDEEGRGPSLRDRRRAAESLLHHSRIVMSVKPEDDKALDLASGLSDARAEVVVDVGEMLPTKEVHELPSGSAKANGKHEED